MIIVTWPSWHRVLRAPRTAASGFERLLAASLQVAFGSDSSHWWLVPRNRLGSPKAEGALECLFSRLRAQAHPHCRNRPLAVRAKHPIYTLLSLSRLFTGAFLLRFCATSEWPFTVYRSPTCPADARHFFLALAYPHSRCTTLCITCDLSPKRHQDSTVCIGVLHF
jgi:hypothetical protein